MAFVYNVNVDNVNQALSRGLALLSASGAREDSRNGPVAVMPGPVMTIYNRPTERVLFSAVRDANPFFHLFESLWMLAGRNDLPWLAQFNKQMASYSDDGGLTQPAAYGYRWRTYFGYDQLEAIVSELAGNAGSRRAVLAMWDGGADRDNSILVPIQHGGDLGKALLGSADVPCNTHCYFRVVNGKLDMMVSCRSNDILWGAYGANAVHFSVLQEYISARLGLPVGTMYQLSFNYHVYLDVLGGPERAVAMGKDAEAANLYGNFAALKPTPIFKDPQRFMAELPHWMDSAEPDAAPALAAHSWEEPFLDQVADPMLAVWRAHKRKDYPRAEALCAEIDGDDWRVACRSWIERRATKHRQKGEVK